MNETTGQLESTRAVVTGSSAGIGRAIALALGRAGADVLVHCRERRREAEDVAAQIRELGRRAFAAQADLSDRSACEMLLQEAWERLGSVEVWVNNAGVDLLTGSAAKLPFGEKLQRLLAVDVTASMILSRAAGERMREAGGGVILNMGWDQAQTGMEGDSGQLFTAAKAAVMAFSKSLALSLAPEVRVNCLAPGWIRTAWGEQASARWHKRVVRETPLRRWGTPEEVAAVACFLASPAASFVTGQIIYINGGAVT